MKRTILSFICCLSFGVITVAQNALTINNVNVKMTGETKLVLRNTQFLNNGNFSADTSTVRITGNGYDEESIIGGDSITHFHNLQVNKTANGTKLWQTIFVDNELRMNSGNLDLNSHDLTLGTANGIIIDEKETSRITGGSGGAVLKTVTLNAPNNVNPGNIGWSLTSADNLGEITIKRGHNTDFSVVSEPNPGGNPGSPNQPNEAVVFPMIDHISRYFEFSQANPALVNVTATFHYFDAELNGLNESLLGFWRQDSSFWFTMPFSTANSSSNTVFTENINLLTRWTLAEEVPVVSLKVLLEGPYSSASGTMRDDLRSSNLIPNKTPYTTSNYDTDIGFGGESISPFILGNTVNDAIVDWVFVELLSPNGSNTKIDSRSGLLQKDGDIVDLDGKSPLTFPNATNGEAYYVVIRHRNHIGIRTAEAILVTNLAADYDFTTDINQILGGTNGIRQLSDGRLALFTGDFDGDGQIQIAGDLNVTITTLGQSGYLFGDFDLNGQVQNTEIQLKLTPNLGRGAQFGY
ncbi:MAG: hypothetical protein AAGA62_07705 [Bacteroidota bacterium]